MNISHDPTTVSGLSDRTTAIAPTSNARRSGRAVLGAIACVVLAFVVLALGAGTADAASAEAPPPSRTTGDVTGETVPANDNFPGQPLGGADWTVYGSNVHASGQPYEPHAPGSAPHRTVWYSWTAPETGPVSFNLRDASFDTTLGVYAGEFVGLLGLVTMNDDYHGSLQSKVTFHATAGSVYRIVVNGYYAASVGEFRLQYSQNGPANDDFASATVLTGATGSHRTNHRRSTGEPGEPRHADDYPEMSVWYSWTAPETGTAVFNTREADFDTILAAYTGTSLNALTPIASNDNFGSPQSQIAFPVQAGTTYRFAVDSSYGHTGALGMQWSINPPANDEFANARALTGDSGATAATTVRATAQPGERDHAYAPPTSSVWFRWTPTVSGPAVMRLRDLSSGYSSAVAVYTAGGPGVGATVGIGDKSAMFNAVGGTEYHIAVAGRAGTAGTFTLEHVLGKCNGLDATILATGAITGTAGNDVIVGSTLADTIDGGAGNDTICGLGGNDVIAGGLGNDREYGNLGNDTFGEGNVPNGTDVLDGKEGRDTANYGPRTTAVNVNLTTAAQDGAPGEGDFVVGTVEDVVGGNGADTLTGSAVANTLRGGGGNDTIRGAGGNDALYGDGGADSLFGEAGMDTLNLVDGIVGNDAGDGGTEVDTATRDAGDTLVNVP